MFQRNAFLKNITICEEFRIFVKHFFKFVNRWCPQFLSWKFDVLFAVQASSISRGLYIGRKKTRGRGKYQLMSFGGKNMKRGKEKGGKCKRKRGMKKEEGGKDEKRGSKRVK